MSLLNDPFDPTRDVALVTRAGNGIGPPIPQALGGGGVKTVFVDISEDRVPAAVKTSSRPDLAVAWVGDLGQPGARNALLAATEAAVGLVTHFVHSASPPRHETDHILAVADETWRQM